MSFSPSFSPYRSMWLLVCFDLPVRTKKQRSTASGFRRKLLQAGFGMLQYSLYCRHCGNQERVATLKRQLAPSIPKQGSIFSIPFTDKQFAQTERIENNQREGPLLPTPLQLELF